MRALTLVLVFLMACFPAAADNYERQPGIDVVHYEIAVELRDSSNVITGTTRLRVAVRQEGISSLWLDFQGMTVDRLAVDGSECNYELAKGRLFIKLQRRYRSGEIFSIEVGHHGDPGKSGLLIGRNHEGGRVFFAENWPSNAHRWFPCIDHPSDKAEVDFLITAPEKYEVVANGVLQERRSLPGGRTLFRWHEGVPVPTYCMVFGAAEFSVVKPEASVGVPLAYYIYPEDIESGAFKFARTNRVIEYFGHLLGPYPYEKLAQVESTTRLGGMENASTIFYAEGGFEKKIHSEAPVPHEVAHQWFGDSVTEGDWDHIWISEGFATYLDALFYAHADGKEAFDRIMKQAAEIAIKYSRSHLSPIIDPATRDAAAKLNPLNYQKGAWVLHMLRRTMGDDRFFRGLRHYYSEYAGRTALTGDFQRIMQEETAEPLDGFFRQWLYQPGVPEYDAAWKWTDGTRELNLAIRQKQRSGLFDMPLDVCAFCGKEKICRTIRVARPSEQFRFLLPAEPDSISIDPDGWVLKTISVHKQ